MNILSTTVGIVRCSDYNPQILPASLQRLAEACPAGINLRSAVILLKPNLISARKSSLACSEGSFILAAAKWYLDHGARVAVGDSPAFGTTRSVLQKIGVLHTLEKMAVRIVDFTHVEPVVLPSGFRTGLAKEALNCDLLVNLPRVKAHAQLRVTLGVKNFFGCVVGMRKPLWHMLYGGTNGPFHSHLVEILTVLPRSITFVDGITAMHRTGPVGGDPFLLGIAACSTNPVAVDRAILEVIGVAPHTSPLMNACTAAGLAGTDMNDLVFPLLRPDEVSVKDFQVPGKLDSVRFNPLRFIRNSIRRIIPGKTSPGRLYPFR